jgi:hypothetical protein
VGERNGGGGLNPNSSQISIPSKYQDLYDMLDAKLNSMLSFINARWDGKEHSVSFAVELISANSHSGEKLLRPEAVQSVAFLLDRLKVLGVKGVKVALHYPILKPDFPNRDGYLEFYRKMSQEVKARNMVLYVATTTTFREPAFTSLIVDYSGLTFTQFKQEMRQHIETVLTNLKPHYLTITNEPETQAMNTRLDFSVQNVKELVQYVLDGLDKKGTFIGAGAGTWDKIEYFQALGQIPGLDYLDMHIYPINVDYVVDRAFRISEIARTYGKKLLLSEAWLYKVRDRELGTATATSADLFARDVFSFWAPLDERFVEAIVKLSHLLKIDFCSFFWMQYFYSYLEYDEQRSAMKPAQLFALLNAEAARNILSDKLSTTGVKYGSLIFLPPSTSSPTETKSTLQKEEIPPRPSFTRLAVIAAVVAVAAVAIIFFLRAKKKSGQR